MALARPFNVREIMADLDDATDDEIRELSFKALRNLIAASPVGDPDKWQTPIAPPGYVGGHFRRNWQVGLRVAPNGEVPGEDANGGPTLQAGKARIDGYRSGIVWLVNNTPYAGRLADGHSTQARPPWVETAIARATRGGGGSRDL